MKRILLGFSLLLSLSLSAQSWQSKPVVRIEDAGQSFLYTFSDSSDAYINKCNVSYIVNLPNSQWVQLGYMYDGSTSRIITASYSAITQPDLASAKILSDTLNAWLVDCAVVVGDSTLQTLSIYGDTLSISDGNSVILPVYVQVDSAVITSYDVLNSQNAPPGSPATGDTYLVGTSPSGAWVGHAKDIAEWNGSSWDFTDGVQGDFLYNATTALTYIFRSGNWVQTTGIPALHNGNNISTGLTLGTRNNKDFNFISNNIIRGVFLSNGSFRVANQGLSGNILLGANNLGIQKKIYLGGGLSLSNDTLVSSGGAFIPLSGTVSGSPVTGDIELINDADRHLFFVNNEAITTGAGISSFFWNDAGVGLRQDKSGSITQLLLDNVSDAFIITSDNPSSVGITGAFDYTANITDLDYTQKKYVDEKVQNAIPLSGTEVGKPVTGVVEFQDEQEDLIEQVTGNDKKSIVGSDASAVSLRSYNTSTGNYSYLRADGSGASLVKYNAGTAQGSALAVYDDNIGIGSDNPGFTGINGASDYSANYSANSFTQKIYVGYRGTATLSSGTVTVSTANIHTGWKVFVSIDTPSGTLGTIYASTSDIVDATSFVINSTNAGDNSTVNWWIAP